MPFCEDRCIHLRLFSAGHQRTAWCHQPAKQQCMEAARVPDNTVVLAHQERVCGVATRCSSIPMIFNRYRIPCGVNVWPNVMTPEKMQTYSPKRHRRQQTTHLTLQCQTDEELLARIFNQYKADLTKTTPRSTSLSAPVTQTHLTNRMGTCRYQPFMLIRCAMLASFCRVIRHKSCADDPTENRAIEGSDIEVEIEQCGVRQRRFSEVSGNCADDVTWEANSSSNHEVLPSASCDRLSTVCFGAKMKLALRRLWRSCRTRVCNLGVRQQGEMRIRNTATRTWEPEASRRSPPAGAVQRPR